MSGLAGKVRKAAESDEFDLANYDQAKCEELCKNAFTDPLPLSNMVRLSFVVGGGKLVRQKYSDDLPKLFMGALSKIGYQDDDSAAVENNSGGKFKYQHDTNKNLKFVHVFPKLGGNPAGGVGGDEEEEEEEDEGPSTPEEALMVFEGEDFERLVTAHLKTYSQVKKLLEMLKERVAKLEAIEQKMIKMEQLSADEQKMFDSIGADAVKDKIKFVTAKLQSMVDIGLLTSAEKSVFLEQLEGKFETIDAEKKKAEAEGKAKKVEALEKQREVLQKTKATLKDAEAVELPPIKYAADLKKLYIKMSNVLRIEKEKKGNFSMDELKTIGEKGEIEDAIAELEGRSRMWLEDDAVFKERIDAVKRAASSAKKSTSSSSGAGRGGGGYSSSSSGWQTAGKKR